MQDYSSTFITAGDSNNYEKDTWMLPISKGGTGVCYKYFDGERLYCKKQLDPHLMSNEKYRAAYRKEFSIGSSLDCPYIVRYLKFTDDDEECSILTDYINGVNLKQRLDYDADYFRSALNIRRFLRQLLLGLQYLHERQIIHMDINPLNIMIASKSNNVQIIDLGFCYSDNYQDTVGTTEAFTVTEVANGTRNYDVRTDIYGVGKVLEYINEKAGLPKRFVRIMRRCLMENEADRYQNVEEMLRVLDSRSRIRTITMSVLSVIVLVALFFYVDGPRHLHRMIYGYEFSYRNIGLNVVSESERTCKVVKHCSGLYRLSVGNISINDEATYRNKWYRIVSVDDSVFKGDTILTTLTINNKNLKIGYRSFKDVVNLRFLELPDELSYLPEEAFAHNKNLRRVRLPSKLTVIPKAVFADCGFDEITVPEGVTDINQDAFANCKNLKHVHLPSTLHTLGRGVFYNCPELESITLPENLELIGNFCFYECQSLRCVYNKSKHPQRAVSVFDRKSKLTIYVPRESVDEYRQAECWRDHDIQPME